jgi:hypothetical protein
MMRRVLIAAGITVGAACADAAPTGLIGGTTPSSGSLPIFSCLLRDDLVFSGGVARDGIPSLEDPVLVSIDHPDAQYIDEYETIAADDANQPPARVVGIFVDGTPIAIPFNILWWHEIVNADYAGRRISITYCPLTGTAIAFDLTAAGIDRFGVSGLIFQNNLIMFDEESGSLWPQMCLNAGDGDRSGFRLETVPVVEMLWSTWKKRYPQSMVVSRKTDYPFDYRRYPYFSYEVSDLLLFPLPYVLDSRVPMKERVLGIMDESGGLAVPFGQLREFGNHAAVNFRIGPNPVTILWDQEGQTAMAFHPFNEEGNAATVTLVNQRFIDSESGSEWSIDGRAISGPRTRESLQHYANSYVAYWFAWASFFPRTRVWSE